MRKSKKPAAEVPETDVMTDLDMPLDDALGYVSELNEPNARLGEARAGADPEATSPGEAVLRGGDPDASKLDASEVGEEAPGMGNPTPDQDIVDEIGAASGVTYNDDEPVRMDDKVEKRDRARWELNPASSEDFDERVRELHEPSDEERHRR